MIECNYRAVFGPSGHWTLRSHYETLSLDHVRVGLTPSLAVVQETEELGIKPLQFGLPERCCHGRINFLEHRVLLGPEHLDGKLVVAPILEMLVNVVGLFIQVLDSNVIEGGLRINVPRKDDSISGLEM